MYLNLDMLVFLPAHRIIQCDMSILDGLNENQQRAVQHVDGPVLVLAGAGSGKTRTLAHRIAYIISEKKKSSSSVLAVTFTNKAAQEMRERVVKLLRIPVRSMPRFTTDLDQQIFPVMGTFHSISVRILRKEGGLLGYKPDYAIYDEHDQKAAIKQAMDELGISPKEINPQNIAWMISSAKNKLLTPVDYAGKADGFLEEIASRVYQSYQDILRRHQAMDFDDLIMNVVGLFETYPDLLERYQDRFQYILIDEYQDTNTAQYRWVSLLAKKNQNIFVVGDDWQAIYGWRGADFHNILNFEKEYPKVKVFYLEQNYRSTQPILDLGNFIIKQNTHQKDKTLWTENHSGDKPRIIEVEDEWREGECILNALGKKRKKESAFDDIVYEYDDGKRVAGMSILERIMQEQRAKKDQERGWEKRSYDIDFSGVTLSDSVVLYRTNAQSRALEEVLLTFGVPYRIIGGLKFYDRKEIKDMLALLRFVYNQDDLVSFDRVIDVVGEGIGPKTISMVRQCSRTRGLPVIEVMKNAVEFIDVSDARAQKLVAFGEMIEDLLVRLEDTGLDDFIDIVGKRTGYFSLLNDGSPENQARLENIAELKTVAKKFRQEKGVQGLSLFLEEVALLTDLDREDARGDQLTLMTLHSAKGLEFKTVFVAGCEEGLLPHSNSMMRPEELEEERRLCYVGITRAKENLYLTHTRQRTIFGKTMVNLPSQFIADMPDELVERIIL
ncbi:MAG: ATP-dependent DNA helicase [Parcubacteria group bacterium GW2011_GWA2_43_13]|nr:MAG: ATP-dependent DNA helicase [Parcubacteria group bacterium GW2011_GWA2_43_13]HAZ17030.1 ATP-dependent DNA helicase PcrA [Candidatus Jacksonbacteria bacterium]